MAERKVTLVLAPEEERALAIVVGNVCANIDEPQHYGEVARYFAPKRERDALGRVNLALNADR